MNKECAKCSLALVKKVCKLKNINIKKENDILNKVKKYQESVDMSKTNPEISGEIFKLITDELDDDNPYKKIKSDYNKMVMDMYDELQLILNKSDDKYSTVLKMCITGNLIDFAAKHKFDENMLREKLINILNSNFTIDHSDKMLKKIKKSNKLLFLGDNCGEIVLDKIFIEYLSKEFPDLEIYYGVRGANVVNDVSMDDALETGMEKVAKVISNGDKSLGTVYDKISDDFKLIFNSADIIISKGQGNFESLQNDTINNIYFLFMTKCEIVADIIGVPTMSILCLENKLFNK